MSKACCILLVFLCFSCSIYAWNVQKEFSGNYQCGIGDEAICYIGDGSFPLNSDVGKEILDSCSYSDDCCVTGIVDEYDNIIEVVSVGICGQESAVENEASDKNTKSGATLLEGFRGYAWREKINLKDKNFTFMIGHSGANYAIFAKMDENKTLGDVNLGNVFYIVKNEEFVGVILNWKDNQNYDVGRQVSQMVADQIDGFEPIIDDKGFHFEKSGLFFQFSLQNNGQVLVGSVEISVVDNTNKTQSKGTF